MRVRDTGSSEGSPEDELDIASDLLGGEEQAPMTRLGVIGVIWA